MNRILVCAANGRERDYWLGLALDDGAELEKGKGPPFRAIFRRLELELRFEIFERDGDADKLRGLELDGVLNLEAVSNQSCRSMIYARLRP